MTVVNSGASASSTLTVSTDPSKLLALLTGATIYGTSTNKTFTLQAKSGVLMAFNGLNLTYDANGMPNGGAIGEISFRSSAGDEYMAWTASFVKVTDLRAAVDKQDLPALGYMFLGGTDTVNGSAFDDVLHGERSNDTLSGKEGADTIRGGDGNDSIDGGADNDSLFGDAGTDSLIGGAGNDTLDGGAGTDLLDGGLGDDSLAGGDDTDDLSGGEGNDTLDGGAGTDWLRGGAGDDKIDGGAGVDTLSYAGLTTAVTVNLKTGVATGEGSDSISNVESVTGGAGNDNLTGIDGYASPVLPNLIKDSSVNNSSVYYATSLDGSFDLESQPDVANSTNIPHATVYARSYYYGYTSESYSFTTYSPNTTFTFDIDSTSNWDSYFYLYKLNANGNTERYLGSQYDGVVLDPGSSTTSDPYWTGTLTEPGKYVLFVSTQNYNAYEQHSYTLHVSLDDPQIVSLPTLDGGAGDDTITGGTSDERIIGGLGADKIAAGGGNDTIILGNGDQAAGETIDGGDGNDTLVIAGQTTSASFTLAAGGISSIETLQIGTPNLTLDASLIGNGLARDARIIMNTGNAPDTITITGAGSVVDLSGWTISGWTNAVDTIVIYGSASPTSYTGSSVNDQITYINATAGITASLLNPADNTGDAAGDSYSGIEQLFGTSFEDRLSGTQDMNRLSGGGGNDMLIGLGGNDFLYGDAGDDILDGGAGADYLDGGAGVDFVSYQFSSAPITRSLETSNGSGDAQGDILMNVEGLIGSAFGDILSGNRFAADTLIGGGGNDWLLGLAGDDKLSGGTGGDVLNGGTGADTLDGGEGIDLAWYRDATSGVALNLATGGTGGDATGDIYVGIENVWGSDFDDTITGDASGSQIYGFAGRDTLDGAGGNDIIYGGEGQDKLTGGGGADVFFYQNWQTDGGDTISDFTSGTDKLMVSSFWFGIPTATAAAIDAASADFVTNGASFSYRPTFLWNATTNVLGFDADGLGSTPTYQLASFASGTTLAMSDIWVA